MVVVPPVPSFRTSDRRKRAFFVTYGAGHVAKVAPVVHALREQGVECIVMALTIGYRRARELGLQPVGYRDFLGLLDDPAGAVARGRAMLEGNTHPEVDDLESCCYLGINHSDQVATLGPEAAEAAYLRSGRQGFMPVGFMGQVIDALQPAVVIATSTPRSEEAAIRAAVSRGIPTLTMVDLFAPPSDPFLARPVHSDRITVISHEVRTRLLASGLRPEQVVVTGSPDFDALFDPAFHAAGLALRRRLGNPAIVVFWAGILEPPESPLPGTELGAAVEERLRAWVRSRPDAALLVRYHPSQYHQFPIGPAQERVHVSVPGQERVEPLLHAADVVIHQVSTVGFQAALLRKRVLHLGFSEWFRRADFDLGSLGPSEQADQVAQLVPLLEGKRTEEAQDEMKMPEGPAAPRVAAEVIRLSNKIGGRVSQLKEEDIRPHDLMEGQRIAALTDLGRLLSRRSEFVEVDCPACGTAERAPKFSKNGIAYVGCPSCRTFYVSPRPSPAVLEWFYRDSPNYAYWNTHIFPASEPARRQRIFRPRVDRLLEICTRHGVRTEALLEVGAGFGTFCSELLARDVFTRVVGVEPTPGLAATCRERGIEVIEKPVEQVEADAVGKFDVVASFEVIEHLFDPAEFAGHMRRLLRPGGLMMLTCPNGLGFDIETLGPLSTTVDHEHLNYFNPQSLPRMLADAGMEVLEVITPGQLDAELVRNQALAGALSLAGQPFLQKVLVDEWDAHGAAFQEFLVARGMSSNLWVVAGQPR